MINKKSFQSTHPIRDATCNGVECSDCPLNFNPRIPLGMRLEGHKIQKERLEFQSTHPIRDATFVFEVIEMIDHFLFQSTHPIRDATYIEIKMHRWVFKFQSTHPIRDATQD